MGLYMVPGRLGQSEMAIDGGRKHLHLIICFNGTVKCISIFLRLFSAVYSAIALVSLYHDLVFVRAVRRRLEERKLTCGGLKLPDER